MLEHAHRLGLDAYGVSFHVGSQQPNPEAWDGALKATAEVFRTLSDRGIQLRMVNLGGGFPAKYLKKIPLVKTYGRAISSALRKHFGNRIPETIIEPGRGMVGDAGIIKAEVVLISKKAADEDTRWVYLDIGKFGGLAETMDEAIRYPIRTPHDGDADGALRHRRADLRFGRRALREDALRPAGVAVDRRRGADRRHRRLHDDLLGRRLQRLRAAEVLRDLSRAPTVRPRCGPSADRVRRAAPGPLAVAFRSLKLRSTLARIVGCSGAGEIGPATRLDLAVVEQRRPALVAEQRAFPRRVVADQRVGRHVDDLRPSTPSLAAIALVISSQVKPRSEVIWKSSPSAFGLPNSLTKGAAKSAERVSVHSDVPSPWTITGAPRSSRRATMSPSPMASGRPVRTVWLGRTIVQGSLP